MPASIDERQFARPRVHTVDGDGNAQHITIAAALAVAVDGDTILIYEGIYAEQVAVDSNIAFVGVGGFDASPFTTGVPRVVIQPTLNTANDAAVSKATGGNNVSFRNISIVPLAVPAAAEFMYGVRVNLTGGGEWHFYDCQVEPEVDAGAAASSSAKR